MSYGSFANLILYSDDLIHISEQIAAIRQLRDDALLRMKDRSFKNILSMSKLQENEALKKVSSYIQRIKAMESEVETSNALKMSEWASQYRDALKAGSVSELQVRASLFFFDYLFFRLSISFLRNNFICSFDSKFIYIFSRMVKRNDVKVFFVQVHGMPSSISRMK